MSRLKRASNGSQQPQVVINQEATTLAIPSTLTEIQVLGSSQISDQNCSSNNNENCSSFRSNDMEASAGKRIEVYMGGRCKKSGAGSLFEEFEKAVGGEGASIVGCKRMGKCRDGPNVRLANVETERNPLCIGVGLEDVGLIVSNFWEEIRNLNWGLLCLPHPCN